MKSNHKIVLTILIFIIPVILFIPGIAQFHYNPGSPYNDISISHYPNMLLIQKTIHENGQIPLWNPGILSGYPFDADPLSGLFYPPGWISLLFKLPLGINLVILLHILAGGFGFLLYLLIRGYRYDLALIGAGSLMLLPKVYAHYGAGHATYIYAFMLTPWLLLVCAQQTKRAYFWKALILAGIILADLRWLPYAVGAWAANGLIISLEKKQNTKDILRNLAINLMPIVGACAISAIFLLPFFQYTQLSTRITMTAADHLSLSLPPANLLGILFPAYGGSAEWVMYTGVGIFLIAILSVFNKDHKSERVWLGVLVLCVLWALGKYIPGMAFLSSLPGMNLLRVPSRALFLGDLATILLMVRGMDWITGNVDDITWKKCRLLFIGLSAFAVIFAGLTVLVAGRSAGGFQIGAEVLVVTVILLEVYRKRGRYSQLALAGILIFSGLDLFYFDTQVFTTVKPASVGISAEGITFLQKQKVTGRLYSPSYSIPQELAAEYGWKLAEGIHPMQLETYNQYLQKASGVETNQYNVVQPALATGNPALDNQQAVPDLQLLARLNVEWIVADFPVQGMINPPDFKDKTTWIYKNPDYLIYPRVMGSAGNVEEVKILNETPNRVEYEANGSAGLVRTSDLVYPGWTVSVNQKTAQIKQDGIFRAVEVPAGNNFVVFEYRPLILITGAVISVLAGIAWIIGIWLWKK
jgi:hypothetical protein